MGKRMLIVPQLLPVANEISAPVTKTSAGNMLGGTEEPRNDVKNAPTCICADISPTDHEKISMSRPGTTT
jgi:hypothetical protein